MMTVFGGKLVPVGIPFCRTRGYTGSSGVRIPARQLWTWLSVESPLSHPKTLSTSLQWAGHKGGAWLSEVTPPSAFLQPLLSSWHPEPQPEQDRGEDWRHREGTSGPSLLDKPSVKQGTLLQLPGSGHKGGV